MTLFAEPSTSLWQVLNNVSVGVFIGYVDQGKLRLMGANKAWYGLFQANACSNNNAQLEAYLSSCHCERLLHACYSCLEYNKQVGQTLLLQDREIAVTLSPLFNQEGRASQVIGTCQEVTSAKPLFLDFLSKYPDGIIVLDPEGIVQFVNRAAELLFDRKAEEIVGEAFGLPIVEGEHTEVEILRRTGEITPAEMRVIQASGTEKNSYIIADLRDARLARIASQQLLHREEELLAIFTAVKKGITFGPAGGNFVLYNPAMEAFTGYTQLEANTQSDFLECLYPDPQEREGLLQKIATLNYQGATCEDEVSIRCRDGTIKYVAVSVSLLFYQGKPMYLSSYTDISARKAAEKRVQYQMEREHLMGGITLRIQGESNIDSILHTTVGEVRQLLQTERVVIFEFFPDWSGRFVVESVAAPWASVLTRKVYDHCFQESYIELYTAGRINTIPDVLTEPIHPCHRDLLLQFEVRANLVVPIVLNGKLWGLLIAHHCSAPRLWQPFEVELLQEIASHVALALQQSTLLQTIRQLNTDLEAQVADRTARLERSLQELERALSKEKELNELKSRFVSMASHEFRTPLATIQAASDALLRYSHQMSFQQQQERLHKIQGEVRRMTDLLEDILSISTVESGSRTLHLEPIDLQTLCHDIITEMRILAPYQHHLEYYYEGVHHTRWVDGKLIRQVLNNLLSNAIKYSPQGGKITLSLHCNLQDIVICVQDRGLGIPLKDQEHIFEAFYRGKNVTSINGTGLGLSIAKSSIELHGGTISLESQEGVGTTFTIVLPIGV